MAHKDGVITLLREREKEINLVVKVINALEKPMIIMQDTLNAYK